MLNACPVRRTSFLGWGVVWSQQYQRTESPGSIRRIVLVLNPQKVTEQMSDALVRPQLVRSLAPALHVGEADGTLSVSSLWIKYVFYLLTTTLTPPKNIDAINNNSG